LNKLYLVAKETTAFKRNM